MAIDTRALAEELASQPYTRVVSLDETTEGNPVYLARILELDGCIAQGTTPEEAVVDLRAAAVDFIEALLLDGLPVPGPNRLVEATAATGATATVAYIGERSVLRKPETISEGRRAYVLTPGL